MLTLRAWDKDTDTGIEPERLPVNNEWARFPNGNKKTWYEPAIEPTPITLTIEGDKAYNVMQLGETLNFTATFSDLTINASIPVSIVNREGIHVANAFVTIKDGIGTGTFTPDNAIDYFVTEEAINFHSAALGVPLVLTEPFYVRVVQS